MPNNLHNRTRAGRMLSAFALLGVLALLVACAPGATPAATQTEPTAEVFIGDLAANATAAGSVTARRAATLNAPAAARVTEVAVRAGQTVRAGEPLVILDTAGAALDVAAAQLDVRVAEAALANLLAEPTAAERAAAEASVAAAQTTLDDLLAGPTAAEMAAYEASLAASQASLAAASADLAGATNSVTAADVAAAEASLAAAQLQLNAAREANEENTNQQTHEALMAAEQAFAAAQARLTELRAGPDTAAAQSGVGAAAARLEAGQADYARQTAGATAAQLAQVEATLADAQASLDDLTGGPTEAEVAAAEADLEAARLALADAEATLARLTITAPFDGVVTAVNVQPGEIAGGAVAGLVDLGSLQVVLQVDEVDVGALAVGQAATVTLEGFPGVTIPAEIAAVAAAARATNDGAVNYEVRLTLAPTDLPLLVGMTADASLVTAEKQDVLLVPNAAVQIDRTNGTYSVNRLLADGATEVVTITVRLRDDQYTEVTGGLSAGDQVLLGGAPVVDLQSEGPGFMGGGQ